MEQDLLSLIPHLTGVREQQLIIYHSNGDNYCHLGPRDNDVLITGPPIMVLLRGQVFYKEQCCSDNDQALPGIPQVPHMNHPGSTCVLYQETLGKKPLSTR